MEHLDPRTGLRSSAQPSTQCNTTPPGQPMRVVRTPAAHTGMSEHRLRRTKAFITQNIASRLSINTLASVAHLSPAHFSRCFATATGLTPHRYVLEQRIERAKEMLVTTDWHLCAIAQECGLGDHAHLCRLFRHMLGFPPSAWRRRHRNVSRSKPVTTCVSG